MAIVIRPRFAYILQQQDPAAKRQMLEIAASYEMNAAPAESRLARKQRSKGQATGD
jgi:hypothetical protein